MRAAIYLHIPFCARKCAYCDFESYADRLHSADEYIERVLDEAARARSEYGCLGVPSAYIGGGTPSLLTPAQLARLILGLRGAFDFDENAEITMEANPGTVDLRKLKAARDLGVNRLSLGAQASRERLLRMLGRIHLWPDVLKAVSLARRAGFDNINLDLMYALPGQTMSDFVDALNAALELSPEHISAYSLILEDGTPLAERVRSGELPANDDDVSINMQRAAQYTLASAGLARYEISNYCLPGRECLHNIAYWTRENYLGLGCAAHSFMNGARFFNPGFDCYMAGRGHMGMEVISYEGAIEETIMLETRMTRGLDLRAFTNSFGREQASAFISRAMPLASGGFLTVGEGFIALTPRGMDVHSSIVYKLLPDS